jgi:N4-gp56 family major capsid protein
MSYFERRALAVLKDECLFYKVADKRPLPKGSGKSVTWSSWRPLAGASSTLSEHSVSANAVAILSSRKVSVTIGSYGRGIQWTDTLELTSILPVEPGALAMLEQSAAYTVDSVIQIAALKNNIVHTGAQTARALSGLLSAWMSAKASVFCADTGASDNTNSSFIFGFPVVFGMSCQKLSSTHAASAATASLSGNLGPVALNKAVTRMKRLGVLPYADGKYLGITHPYAVGSMLRNPDFKSWAQGWEKGVTETLYKNAIGVCNGVAIMESPRMPRFEGSLLDNRGKNLNLTLIVGRASTGEAPIAMTELDGGVKFIYHRPEQTADAFELKSTLTYKIRAAAAVLNPSCGVILITQDLMAPVTTIS